MNIKSVLKDIKTFFIDIILHHRRELIIGILSCVLFIAVVSGILVIHSLNSLEMPLKYSNEELIYTKSTTAGISPETGFAYSLCVSSGDVGNSAIQLQGAESGALFSLDDKEVLYSKNLYEKIYPASITKLMTGLLALKYSNMEETVTINWMDLELETGSQVVGLHIGDRVTMRDLMRGLLVHSGNDAAQAIARHVGGTQNAFVQMMNQELVNIGATGTHFVNPTGLHDPDHYTTIYDIYLMLNECLKYDDFVTIIQTPVYELTYTNSEGIVGHITLDSTDHYLTGDINPPKDVTVIGGKTGTTSIAGNCLAIESQNAYGQPYISIITGATTKDALYADMNQLLALINN